MRQHVELDLDDDPRWSRRLRVYRAEDKAAANHPLPHLDGTRQAAQDYVDRIVRSRWWSMHCPPYVDPDSFLVSMRVVTIVHVEVTEGRRGGGYALRGVRWYDRGRGPDRVRGGCAQIRLGRGVVHSCAAIADPWVILHELAHVMTMQRDRGHGPVFARAYVDLVRRWVGRDAAAALRAACEAEGLRLRRARVPANRLSTG